jgi:hypothetical protein
MDSAEAEAAPASRRRRENFISKAMSVSPDSWKTNELDAVTTLHINHSSVIQIVLSLIYG